MTNVAIAFKKPLVANPFALMGEKQPVYEEFMAMFKAKGWNAYVVSTSTYTGEGIFDGSVEYKDNHYIVRNDKVKMDVVYDRSGGRAFPLEDDSLQVVDSRVFKLLAWNKWQAYTEIGEYMPKTVLITKKADITPALKQIPGEMVVLKPHNGLKGAGIYIGKKDGATNFAMEEKGLPYLMQEFVETQGGIPGIVNDRHDLRVVVINKKIVWSHVRIPPVGTFKANVARDGHLREVDINVLPKEVRDIVTEVADKFFSKYDNPVFSLDFGFGENGKPYVFEINDQIGFPRPWMKAKDTFLTELIANLESKLK